MATLAQLTEEKNKLERGLFEARLQVARFEGALEFLNYLISSAPTEGNDAQNLHPNHIGGDNGNQ